MNLRFLSLVGIALLLMPIAALADSPIQDNTASIPSNIALGSRWEISAQPTVGGESEQHPQIIGSIMTQRDTFEVMPVSISYKPTYDRTLILTLPYIRRSEELRLGTDSMSTASSGLGDVTLRLERTLNQAGMAGWEKTLGLSLSIPTGRSIYDNLSQDELPLGIGHYGTGVHLDYRRIADPFVAYFGAGMQYLWPRTNNGEHIRPGIGFSVRTGIGYALSDRCVMTEQLEFTRQPNVLVQSAIATTTETIDQAYITHGFIYSRSPDSPSYCIRFSVGLNSQSTDFIVSIGSQK